MTEYIYPNVVKAAGNRNAALFEFADALIADIAPVALNERGNRNNVRNPEDLVSIRLAEAAREIEESGSGEVTVAYLRNLRQVGLWKGNREWIPGLSFTVHEDAMKAGLSIDELAMPHSPKTSAAIRALNKGERSRQASEAIEGLLADQLVEVVHHIAMLFPVDVMAVFGDEASFYELAGIFLRRDLTTEDYEQINRARTQILRDDNEQRGWIPAGGPREETRPAGPTLYTPIWTPSEYGRRMSQASSMCRQSLDKWQEYATRGVFEHIEEAQKIYLDVLDTKAKVDAVEAVVREQVLELDPNFELPVPVEADADN